MAAFGINVLRGAIARFSHTSRHVLRHVPVEIRRLVRPPDRTSLAESSLDLVDGHVRGGFCVAVCTLLRVADRPTGRAQPSNQIGSLRLVESRVRHAPQPATDDEVVTVRRHRMLHVR